MRFLGEQAWCLRFAWLLPCSALLVPSTRVHAQALGRAEVLALARRTAPRIVASRSGVAEAEARLRARVPLLPDDPRISLEAGPRFGGGDPGPQLGASVEQEIPLSSARRAGHAALRSRLEAHHAERDGEVAAVLGDVLEAFVAALDATAREALAMRAQELAGELARAVARRAQAGEVAALEAEIAQAALLRARAAHRTAEAARVETHARLGALLGTRATPPVRGDLSEAPAYTLDGLLRSARRRPELRGWRATGAEARAVGREARARAAPVLGVGARYDLERDEHAAQAVLSLSLPLLDRAAGERRAAAAVGRAADVALRATWRAIDAEVRGRLATYQARRDALVELDTALPAAEQIEARLRGGYERGGVTMAELLVLRAELLELRRERLDALRELALARVRLELAAGVVR